MEEFCLRLLMFALVTCHFTLSEIVSAESNSSSTRHRSVSSVLSCPAPEPCGCERSPGKLILNCRHHGLYEVPTFSQSEELVDELTLASNRLVALPNYAFRGLRVRRLDLEENNLRSISAAAFSGLEAHLEELRIQLDRTAEFPSKALASLTLLRVLSVINYGHASLPSSALSSFSQLYELRLTSGTLQALLPSDVAPIRTSVSVVDLSGNPLRGVPSATLATLSNLTEVFLSGCQIFHLSSRAFAFNWTGLRRIDLSSNQLEVWIFRHVMFREV